MHSWFLYTIAAPFLFALTNISDKYLVGRYAKSERSSGGLVLFSSLYGLLAAFIIGIFVWPHLNIILLDKIILLFVGGLTVLWVTFYLYALELEDVSAVIPWFLSIPIWSYVLGYLFLGETLSLHQKVGSLVIFLGLIVLSIDFSKQESRKFKWKVFLYMLCASLIIAITGVLFKYVTVAGNFWVSSFWEYLGLGITGVMLFAFAPKYRREFNQMNKEGGTVIFGLNLASEVLNNIAHMLITFSLLLAPITLVYLIESFQPAILLFLTILGTYLFPKLVQENLNRRVLIPKIVAIAIMVLGSIILFI